MKTANRRLERHRGIFFRLGTERGKLRAGATQRWVLVGGASLVCCALIAVRNGAEQVDSGWAVGVPSPLGSGQTPSPEQQLVLRHVLEQTKSQPFLSEAAPGQAAPAQATQS